MNGRSLERSGACQNEEPITLVLSRKKNEGIVINNDIMVTVVEIRADKVRLGIVAPSQVPVHRQEVQDALQNAPPHEFSRSVQSTKPEPPFEDPWHLPSGFELASAEANERRAGFLGRLARTLKEKSGKEVTLSSIVQAIIDGVYYSSIDLSQTDSLEHLKQVLARSIKPPT
jgi:carbon storage regulator